jgi:hypothetical protein
MDSHSSADADRDKHDDGHDQDDRMSLVDCFFVHLFLASELAITAPSSPPAKIEAFQDLSMFW